MSLPFKNFIIDVSVVCPVRFSRYADDITILSSVLSILKSHHTVLKFLALSDVS